MMKIILIVHNRPVLSLKVFINSIVITNKNASLFGTVKKLTLTSSEQIMYAVTLSA